MGIQKIQKASSVLKAIEEYGRLGRDAFLHKYGFGEAKEYFLIFNGRYYDSKVIIGVAYGFEYPKEGHLSAEDFVGGKPVKQKLEKLGFTVVVE